MMTDLYQLERGPYPAESGPRSLVCPGCKADGSTFVAYESSGSYH